MAEARGNIKLRWVGDEALDLVALTRMRAFAHASRDLSHHLDALTTDPHIRSGDCLLAESGGEAIATTTSLSLTMWVRGAAIPCQGVAYVGTIKTHRRRGGVASALMRETLNKARERGQILSALMPFRPSFYEHFGYGLVERLCEWTIPMPILPAGDFDGFRFYAPGDLDGLAACKQRVAEAGQCDIERPLAAWELLLKKGEEGFTVIDRPDANGPVLGWMMLVRVSEPGRDLLRVIDHGAVDEAALMRQLHFLSSLKDQYYAVSLITQADYPLNWLLNERQMTRGVTGHPTSIAKPTTRMQIRVLDHVRLINAIHVQSQARGAVSVRVMETEGVTSAFQIEYGEGRAAATPLQSGKQTDIECDAVTWAAVIMGNLPAAHAWRMGLLNASNAAAIEMLHPLTVGPAPFTPDHF